MKKEKIKQGMEAFTLYCVRCRAPHTGYVQADFPSVCPSCKRATFWTETTDLDDNAPFFGVKKRRVYYGNKVSLDDVYTVTEKHLYVDDRNRIDVILATVISNEADSDPIWIIIVGPSGDWKTEFTRGLKDCYKIIPVDQLTPNTLASGKKGAKDLGSELNGEKRILLFFDLAAMTSKTKEDKKQIWAQMRNLYDGFINKRTGSGVSKKYDNCHVSMIACSTEAIRDEIIIHAQLGTRELMYDTGGDMKESISKMRMAWRNEDEEKQMRKEIRRVVTGFVETNHLRKDMAIPDEIKDFIFAEAQRLAILRASATSDYDQELINPVYPEIPTRVVKQFKLLYKSLKSLDDEYPDDKAKEIIRHIVDSSGEIIRQFILDIFIEDVSQEYKISDLQKVLHIGRKAIKRQLEALWNLQILTKHEDYEEINPAGGRGVIKEVAHYKLNEKSDLITQITKQLKTPPINYDNPPTYIDINSIIYTYGGEIGGNGLYINIFGFDDSHLKDLGFSGNECHAVADAYKVLLHNPQRAYNIEDIDAGTKGRHSPILRAALEKLVRSPHNPTLIQCVNENSALYGIDKSRLDQKVEELNTSAQKMKECLFPIYNHYLKSKKGEEELADITETKSYIKHQLKIGDVDEFWDMLVGDGRYGWVLVYPDDKYKFRAESKFDNPDDCDGDIEETVEVEEVGEKAPIEPKIGETSETKEAPHQREKDVDEENEKNVDSEEKSKNNKMNRPQYCGVCRHFGNQNPFSDTEWCSKIHRFVSRRKDATHCKYFVKSKK